MKRITKKKCHHCGKRSGHVRNCIVMVAKHGIRLPGGTTANERAKAAAKIDQAKFICPSCGIDTQRVDCVAGITFACQNCNISLVVTENGSTIRQVNPPTVLDDSDVATILAALRLFQDTYVDHDSVSIAEAWPMHFNVQGDGEDITVVPDPLGSIRIDELCEKINCAGTLSISR
jgi:hypothetical protein